MSGIITLIVCVTIVVTAHIISHNYKEVKRLEKAVSLREMDQVKEPTTVENPLKQSVIKSYTVEDD